jgi:hypothetical protein
MPLAIEEPAMGSRHRQLATGAFVPLLIGSFAVFDLTQKSRFASFHTVDVVQLVASGMCFGIALTALIEFLRKPQSH